MKTSAFAPLGFQAAFILLIVASWFAATKWLNVPVILLPTPESVAEQFSRLIRSGAFLAPLQITVFEVAAAFLIAAISGLGVGYAVSTTIYGVRVFEPIFTAIYAVPAILFFPLYALFFGLGPPSKIALGATISFFPIVLNTIAGFKSKDGLYVRAATSLGASRLQMFWYVLLPTAFPVVLAGLRMGLILSFLSVLGAETIASFAGLGHQIMQNSETMDSDIMYAYIVFVIFLAFVLNSCVGALTRRWERGFAEDDH